MCCILRELNIFLIRLIFTCFFESWNLGSCCNGDMFELSVFMFISCRCQWKNLDFTTQVTHYLSVYHIYSNECSGALQFTSSKTAWCSYNKIWANISKFGDINRLGTMADHASIVRSSGNIPLSSPIHISSTSHLTHPPSRFTRLTLFEFALWNKANLHILDLICIQEK